MRSNEILGMKSNESLGIRKGESGNEATSKSLGNKGVKEDN